MKKLDLKNMNIDFILKSSYNSIKKYLSVSEAQKFRTYCRNSEYAKAINILKNTLKIIDVPKGDIKKALDEIIDENDDILNEVFDSEFDNNENEGENENMNDSAVTVAVENSSSPGYIAAIIIAFAIVILIVIVIIKKNSGSSTLEIKNDINLNNKRDGYNTSQKIIFSESDKDLLEVIHLLADTYNTTEEYLK